MEEQEGAPPDYETTEGDKKSDKFKLTKPLKSIMKQGEKMGEKIRRRESEAKKQKDAADGHSPRQSMVVSQSLSMVSAHSSSSINGETDPNTIQVSIASSN